MPAQSEYKPVGDDVPKVEGKIALLEKTSTFNGYGGDLSVWSGSLSR